MQITILGGGPAGLYSAILLKKAWPDAAIMVIERNPPDVTYGWGVVFSDRTLAGYARADEPTYRQITDEFVIWDAINVRYRGTTIRCGGHVIASVERRRLLHILQERCRALGVDLRFGQAIESPADLAGYDLLIAADGVNSVVRRAHEDVFGPRISLGEAHYIWLGAAYPLDAFTFYFFETPHGLFQVHAYPFTGTTSTFIVECSDETWRRAGLDTADEAASLAFCQALLDADLHGARLLSNHSHWIQFPTLTTRTWHHGRTVILGDTAHTAHFSIGSGTKLAMDDAIALVEALTTHADIESALAAYEAERRPVVAVFQRAARESQIYFETLARYLRLPPLPFAFQLLTRSGRITYDDLRLRDTAFAEAVDRWYAAEATGAPPPLAAPPPLFSSLHLRDMSLVSRLVVAPRATLPAPDGRPPAALEAALIAAGQGGAGLVLAPPLAVSAEGRVTPDDLGLYDPAHAAAWAGIGSQVQATGARLGIEIGHAGRRGATRPRTRGTDRPLPAGGWPLLAPSPLPYTPARRVPAAMDRAAMDGVRDAFVRAARWAGEAGADLLVLGAAQGYLLGSFLSPLTNRRDDAYGGDLAGRLRFPLEVLVAVRAAWPESRPLAVALTADDCVRGGAGIAEAVAVARAMRAAGGDLVLVRAGGTVPEGEPAYGRGFLTAYSDRIRNEANVPTLVGGYLPTTNDMNTVLAAGRADLCLLEPEIHS